MSNHPADRTEYLIRVGNVTEHQADNPKSWEEAVTLARKLTRDNPEVTIEIDEVTFAFEDSQLVWDSESDA